MSLTRVAVVTGAANGIGRAVALRLAADGLDVSINDTSANKDKLVSLKVEVESMGRQCSIVIADVSSEEQVKEMIATTVSTLGRLDAMVANAGIGAMKPLNECTVEDWDRLFDVNAKGVFYCYKHASLQMIKQGQGGRIIGASSIAGKRPAPNAGIYAASKFAVRALTQVAALEYGKYGITCNSYAPGVIDTPLMDKNDEEFRAATGSRTSLFDPVIKATALGFKGQPNDVAPLISFLASQESRYITGQCYSVDAGLSMD